MKMSQELCRVGICRAGYAHNDPLAHLMSSSVMSAGLLSIERVQKLGSAVPIACKRARMTDPHLQDYRTTHHLRLEHIKWRIYSGEKLPIPSRSNSTEMGKR